MPDTDEQVFIKVDGRQVDLAAAKLIRVTLEQALLLPDAFNIVLAAGLDWLKDGTFDIGKEVKLELAQGAARKTLLTGEVTGLMPSMTADNEVQLHVRGYDKSHRLLRGRYTRSFVQSKDSDIAQRIAQEMGLGSDVTATSEVYDYVLQHNQTNLEFLQQRASAIGYQVGVNEGSLYFAPVGDQPAGTGSQPQELKWGDNLEEFEVSYTTPGQATEVLVRGWDPKRKEVIVGQARSSEVGPELKDKSKGGELVKKAFSMDAPMTVFREDVSTQSAAETLAQSICDEMQGGFTTAEGLAGGDPNLRPGTDVQVSGVGRFDGKYRVSSVTHTFDREGYRTSFCIEGSRRPQTPLTAPHGDSNRMPNYGFSIGIVTNNEDPLDMGRIKVKLPSLAADLESDWCRLLSPSAGPDRGFFFLPEVGDEVLVGFMGAQPVIMGSLWNGKDAPPYQVDTAVDGGAVVQRAIRSRSGHLILFDDTDKSEMVIIEDKNGNQIVIDSADNKLSITTKGDIELEAKGNFRLKAGGTMDLEASGRLNIKGSRVNIN
jgi:phage protein D